MHLRAIHQYAHVAAADNSPTGIHYVDIGIDDRMVRATISCAILVSRCQPAIVLRYARLSIRKYVTYGIVQSLKDDEDVWSCGEVHRL